MVGGANKRYKGIRSLGVKQAPFYVLIGAQMPAVLVEVGFLSNDTERKRLISKDYQDRLAAGICEGITPNLVSSDWFRHQFEMRATQTLHRSITVRDLQWTWKKGIRIEGLAAADGPQYGNVPLLSVDELLISVDFEL
ncbi:MAG: hypothetical protein B6240_05380, partial [Desulfobacteraceae bacterium 4572_87]